MPSTVDMLLEKRPAKENKSAGEVHHMTPFSNRSI